MSRAEMILAEGPKKKAAEPQRDKSRNRPVHVREDAQLGSGRKIGSDKGGVSNQNPISGAPSKGNKPPTGSSRPGGMDVSVDPSARPKPGTLERGKAFEGLPGQKPVDSRLTDRAADPKGRVQETGDSRLQDPRSGGGAGSAALKPGDTRYGSKESMIGQDATGTPQNRITSDHVGNVPEIGKSLQNLSGTAANTELGIQRRQATEEDLFQNAERKPSSDGKVLRETLPNGTVRVTNTDNGTQTTLFPDGSTQTVDSASGKVIDKTPPTSIPDPENESAPLPADLQKQIDADVAAARKQARVGGSRAPGGADPNHTDPVPDGDDATGTGSGAADKTKAVPVKSGLIVNPGSPGASSSSSRPTLDQQERPSGSDPNETDPAPEEP